MREEYRAVLGRNGQVSVAKEENGKGEWISSEGQGRAARGSNERVSKFDTEVSDERESTKRVTKGGGEFI